MSGSPSRPALDPSESLARLVRAVSALFVVLDHAPTLFDMPNVPKMGSQAVMVFMSCPAMSSATSRTHGAERSRIPVARLARL